MSGEPSSHLRNRPRQARSVARVELLLDVAEEVFEEVGFDGATTNLVAARAEVPVGTLYRWFPDKAALAEGVADRYLADLTDLYDSIFSSVRPEEHLGDLVRRAMSELIKGTRHHKALPALLVSAMVPGGRSTAGERLREGLESRIRDLIELRVPGVPAEGRDRATVVATTLTHLAISSMGTNPSAAFEYIDTLLTYLDAKFPEASDPVWDDPDGALVRPIFPGAPHQARVSRT